MQGLYHMKISMLRTSDLPKLTQIRFAKSVLENSLNLRVANTNVFFLCNDFCNLLTITKDYLKRSEDS